MNYSTIYIKRVVDDGAIYERNRCAYDNWEKQEFYNRVALDGGTIEQNECWITDISEKGLYNLRVNEDGGIVETNDCFVGDTVHLAPYFSTVSSFKTDFILYADVDLFPEALNTSNALIGSEIIVDAEVVYPMTYATFNTLNYPFVGVDNTSTETICFNSIIIRNC